MVQHGTGEQAIGAQELVTTSDQHRLFRRDTYLSPIDHGSVDTVSALSTLYLLPSCTRGVWPADTCWVASQGCEYRCISGSNATAVWRAVGAGQGAAGTATWGGIVGDIEAQTDIGAVLAGKADSTHGHEMSAVAGLAAALGGKWATPANAAVLADLGDSSGTLTYRGSAVTGGGAAYVGARAMHTIDQGVGSGAPLVFSSCVDGGLNFWDAGTPNRLTIPAGLDGWYLILGHVVQYAGSNYAHLTANGGGLNCTVGPALNTSSYLEPHTVGHLAAGDYVQFFVQGGPTAGASEPAVLSLSRIG